MSNLHDLIIIGGGPAGCSAGIYAGRSRLRALVLDPADDPGQISITSQVVNYPGIPETSGEKLMQDMRAQVASFGVPVKKNRVRGIRRDGDLFQVETDGETYTALAVMAATGAKPRAAGFENEERFRGRGVGYCATCDGQFFEGKDIFVIGGGFAAAEEAIFLTRYAKKVHIIHVLPEFTCSQSIAEEVLAHPGIEVHFNTEMVRLEGETFPTAAVLKNTQTGEEWRYEAPAGDTFGTFVFVGYQPVNEYLAGACETDAGGYVPTDDALMTSTPGLFAAGDLRPKALRQLVTAVSDGALAATSAERYVTEQKGRLGIEVPAPYAPSQDTAAEEKAAPAVSAKAEAGSALTSEIIEQLQPVLARLERPVRIAAVLKDDGGALDTEVAAYARDFAALSDKLSAEVRSSRDPDAVPAGVDGSMLPLLTLLREDGSPTGIAFHGVPGGHEFTSFVLALYNVSGPGQPVEPDVAARIEGLPVRSVKVGISLSCTMCPDVMAAAALVAARHPGISAEMVDIAHFPEFGKRHGIMSVPAIVLDEGEVHFGKKSLAELVDILAS